MRTLEVADKAMNMAIHEAENLNVPLIVAGDLHDTKANLRAECVNRMIDTFSRFTGRAYIMRGNHDSLNEKSKESACYFLGFLGGLPDLIMVDAPTVSNNSPLTGVHLIPYEHDPIVLRSYLSAATKGSTLIMHQGLKGTNSGEYIQDKSAITFEDVKDFRVISGHYHQRQDIKTGRPQRGGVGMFSYIGNPYTLNYGEAGDPPKGFQVLYEDGSTKFIPTNLRKHVVFNLTTKDIGPQTILVYNPEDLLWLKITGTSEAFATLTRDQIIAAMGINAAEVRIDFITPSVHTNVYKPASDSGSTLDNLIESANISEQQKVRLKDLWKSKV
jgi:DNA repair exonuclease SbcCD nuclease subunit